MASIGCDEDKLTSQVSESESISESDGVFWNCIPQNVLEHIFLYLCMNDRCNASSTCRLWRDCLFSPSLWRDMSFTLSTCKDADKLSFLAECTKYSHNLRIVWPYQNRSSTRSAQDTTLRILKSIQKVMMSLCNSTNLRCFQLQFENTWSCHNSYISDIQCCVDKMLEKNAKLEFLSLGCNLTVTSPMFLDKLSKDASVNLKELHLGHVQVKDRLIVLKPFQGEGVLQDEPLPALCSSPMVFVEMRNLHKLGICWGHVTSNLVEALCKRNNPVPLERLSIFVNQHSCVGNSSVGHPDKEQWSCFAKKHRKVRISLIFVCKFDGLCSHLEEIRPGVSCLKFLEYTSVEPDDVGVVMLWHRETLETLVHCCQWDPVMLENGHEFWPYITQCMKLKHLAFIGHFIPDEVLVLLASQFSSTLETLVVSKSHIISFAEATDFMIPISGGRYNAIKREVSGILGRPWEAVSRIPLSGYYFSEGLDDDFFTRL